MMIYYPNYYLVPVAPVMFSYENEYNTRYNDDEYNTSSNDEYNIMRNDEYSEVYNNNYASKNTISTSEIYNIYRTINEDIFYEVDEEYVNINVK